MIRDEYRVNLFKKKLREILNCSWVRFNNSKDRSHLVVKKWSVGEKNLKIMIELLKRAGIEVVVRSDVWWPGSGLYSMSIPIDQAALPERKRNVSSRGRILAECWPSQAKVRSRSFARDGFLEE